MFRNRMVKIALRVILYNFVSLMCYLSTIPFHSSHALWWTHYTDTHSHLFRFRKFTQHVWLNDRCLALIHTTKNAEGTPSFAKVACACNKGILEKHRLYIFRLREQNYVVRVEVSNTGGVLISKLLIDEAALEAFLLLRELTVHGA